MKRAFVAIVGGLALLAPQVARAEDCPDPKTCPNYQLENAPNGGYVRWGADGNGIVMIPYYVNPSGQEPYFREPMETNQVVGAVQAAFATWAAWNPQLRFVYQGLTDARPGSSALGEVIAEYDGKSVIGFRRSTDPNAAASTVTQKINGRIVESDIWLSPTAPWAWRPCEQRDDSCMSETHYRRWITVEDVPMVGGDLEVLGTLEFDLQAILTHEIGHLLGLLHPNEGTKSYRLTMAAGAGSEDPEWKNGEDYRQFSTLGLGDVLGAKALYPWSCPAAGPGQSLPPVYRYLCPSITIFSP